MTKIKIDFDKHQLVGCIPVKYVGCIPVKYLYEAPTDQSTCTKEPCQVCNDLMWLSENKKKYMSARNNCLAVCFVCIGKAAQEQGRLKEYFELFDINKVN